MIDVAHGAGNHLLSVQIIHYAGWEDTISAHHT